jgi:hypothetical protein
MDGSTRIPQGTGVERTAISRARPLPTNVQLHQAKSTIPAMKSNPSGPARFARVARICRIRVGESWGPQMKKGLPFLPNGNVSIAMGISPKIASAWAKSSLGARPKPAAYIAASCSSFASNRRINVGERLLSTQLVLSVAEFLRGHNREKRVLNSEAPDVEEEKTCSDHPVR